jgi:hypothetical protein
LHRSCCHLIVLVCDIAIRNVKKSVSTSHRSDAMGWWECARAIQPPKNALNNAAYRKKNGEIERLAIDCLNLALLSDFIQKYREIWAQKVVPVAGPATPSCWVRVGATFRKREMTNCRAGLLALISTCETSLRSNGYTITFWKRCDSSSVKVLDTLVIFTSYTNPSPALDPYPGRSLWKTANYRGL